MAKLLIVEDSAFFRRLLKETILSRHPTMDILEAPSAEDALTMMNGFTPDLIFVDIQLPGESGLEFSRKIKRMHPNIPIIILTSYDLPEYREAAKAFQTDYFLSKGTTTKRDILEMITSILKNT